jgi:hypothetical protein
LSEEARGDPKAIKAAIEGVISDPSLAASISHPPPYRWGTEICREHPLAHLLAGQTMQSLSSFAEAKPVTVNTIKLGAALFDRQLECRAAIERPITPHGDLLAPFGLLWVIGDVLSVRQPLALLPPAASRNRGY